LHKDDQWYTPYIIDFTPDSASDYREVRNIKTDIKFDETRVQQPSPPFKLFEDKGFVHYIYRLDDAFFSLGGAQQQLDKVVAFVEKAYESFESMRL
jgi:hypothetical protein